MIVLRRVHNKLHIKQSTQNSDSNLSSSGVSQMPNKKNSPNSYRVFIEYVAVLLVIIIPISVQAGIFTGGKGNSDVNNNEIGTSIAESAIDVNVLSALKNPNPSGSRGGAEVLVNEGTLVSSGPVGADLIAISKASTGEISVYTVREGDTLSHIAEMYGVTANTILWANDLPRATSIRAGQTLVILPIAGVRHVVKKGDTINSIAKKYEGDIEEITSYNDLLDGSLEVGSTIVVPGGAIHSAPVVKVASPVRSSGTTSSGGSWLSHPVPGALKTQGLHGYNAVDLAGALGSTIRAAAAGEVIVSKSSGWNGGYGQYIVIKHSNGAQTLYAHLSYNSVGVGAYVAQGEAIASMGNTGKSTGSHLHFEVRGAKNPF
jgi:murein DD-endopeptidase MepM/ murein hydrolase activator NlpD